LAVQKKRGAALVCGASNSNGPGHDQKAEDAATALLDGMFIAIQKGMPATAESIWSRCGAALRAFEPGLSFAEVKERPKLGKDLTRPDGPRHREA
jgi:hypothetical protein